MVLFESLFILAGVVGLWIGSDFAVDAAKKIASMLHVSDLIVGLTIASIGTSLPEIFTNLAAGFSTLGGKDASGIAVGNIIGSNLGQITLILGIVGWFSTLQFERRALRRDGMMMLLALFLMFLACIDGYVAPEEGLFLVAIYGVYLWIVVSQEKVVEKIKDHRGEGNMPLEVLKTLAGIAVVIYAADVVVQNGVYVASTMGLSESFIGIFIGLGTSIPELSVSIRAAMKHSGQLSLGNLIGSNITDPLLSFGLGASVAGVIVSAGVIHFDMVYWLAATLIALLMLFNHMDLNKKESSVLIILYLLFIYLRIMFLP